MKNKEDSPEFTQTETKGQLFNPEIKYGVNYQWGSLRVSTEASDFYGMIPLTTTVTPEDVVSVVGNDFVGINITLLTPGEIVEQRSKLKKEKRKTYIDDDDGMSLSSAVISGNSVDLNIALNLSHKGLTDSILGQFTLLANSFGVEKENILDQNNIPITDQVQNDTPQMIAHMLTRAIKDKTHNVAKTTMSNNIKSILDKKLSLSGIGWLTMLTAMGGVEAYKGDFNALSAITVTSFSWLGMMSVKRQARNMIEVQEKANDRFEDIAEILSSLIASEIHKIYCSNHFNSEAEDKLQ